MNERYQQNVLTLCQRHHRCVNRTEFAAVSSFSGDMLLLVVWSINSTVGQIFPIAPLTHTLPICAIFCAWSPKPVTCFIPFAGCIPLEGQSILAQKMHRTGDHCHDFLWKINCAAAQGVAASFDLTSGGNPR